MKLSELDPSSEVLSLPELRRRLTAGTSWDVTNHFITRPDHYCFGTRRAEILRTTTGGFYLPHPERPDGDRVRWPKAGSVRATPEGRILIFGHPKWDDLFLTLEPVGSTADTLRLEVGGHTTICVDASQCIVLEYRLHHPPQTTRITITDVDRLVAALLAAYVHAT